MPVAAAAVSTDKTGIPGSSSSISSCGSVRLVVIELTQTKNSMNFYLMETIL
jgi:hypothetical protein